MNRDIRVTRGPDCWRGEFQAMASPCEVLVEGGDAGLARRLAGEAADEAWRIEARLSRYIPGNIVDAINTAGGAVVEVDEETASLLDFAATLYELSSGRFDITSGVLRKAWTFDGGDSIPSRRQVAKILERVGWHRVEWTRPTLRMPAGMQIDFGGIGKEYAVDRAAQRLRDATTLGTLVNLGGDLAVSRQPRQREAWKVGIESLSPGAAPAERIIDIRAGALATSGDARRFVEKDGVRYGHILDPGSGWPVSNAPKSVTVAADTCTQAGMLSTLAMLEGGGAEAFLEAEGVRHWCRR